MSKEHDLPRLDLSQFVFTPPGPMGWAFDITEEDIQNAKEGILNIIETEERLTKLGEVYEIGLNVSKRNITVDSLTQEVEIEEEKQEIELNNIKIVLPLGPLKAPWLQKKMKKHRKKKGK